MNSDMKAIKTAEECDYWFQQAAEARAKMEGMAGAIRGLHEKIEMLQKETDTAQARVLAISDFCVEAARTRFPIPAGLAMMSLDGIRERTHDAVAHVRQENTTPGVRPESLAEHPSSKHRAVPKIAATRPEDSNDL